MATELQEKTAYADYVATQLACNGEIMPFAEWVSELREMREKMKPFRIELWSEVVHARITFPVDGKDENDAYCNAVKLLNKFESQYRDNHGINIEDQLQKLKTQLRKKEESMQRKLDKMKKQEEDMRKKIAEMKVLLSQSS